MAWPGALRLRAARPVRLGRGGWHGMICICLVHVIPGSRHATATLIELPSSESDSLTRQDKQSNMVRPTRLFE
jgi:hypothetical protein